MIADITDWTELREFRHVELTQSFVLSWLVRAHSLLIDIDLCLARDHAFYEAPRPAERVCVRAAILEFPRCTLLGDGESAGDPTPVAQRLAGGAIHGFCRHGAGRYLLRGAFGTVEICSERPILRLKSPADTGAN